MHVKGNDMRHKSLTSQMVTSLMVGDPSAKFYKRLASVSHMYQLLRAEKGLLLLYVLRHLVVAILFQNYLVL